MFNFVLLHSCIKLSANQQLQLSNTVFQYYNTWLAQDYSEQPQKHIPPHPPHPKINNKSNKRGKCLANPHSRLENITFTVLLKSAVTLKFGHWSSKLVHTCKDYWIMQLQRPHLKLHLRKDQHLQSIDVSSISLLKDTPKSWTKASCAFPFNKYIKSECSLVGTYTTEKTQLFFWPQKSLWP